MKKILKALKHYMCKDIVIFGYLISIISLYFIDIWSSDISSFESPFFWCAIPKKKRFNLATLSQAHVKLGSFELAYSDSPLFFLPRSLILK